MLARQRRNRWYSLTGLLLVLAVGACDDDSVDIQFPAPVNDHWWDGFDSQGLNGYVHVLGEFEGDLVAGGLFTAAGTTTARSIARWDGEAWSSFGSGMDRTDCGGATCAPLVSALTSFEGGLVVGGRFTAAGTSPAANVAFWDGATWSALGDGFDDTVFALTSYGGEIVAGGYFTRSGADTTVRHLARWDGTAWRSLGGGTNAVVRTLIAWDGKLVVGGDFTLAGGQPAGYVGIWDGQSWTLPAPFLDNRVRAATIFQGDLILAGDFHRLEDGSLWAANVMSWDGSTWGRLADLNGDGTALCVYGSRLVAGGSFTRDEKLRVARFGDRGWLGLGSGVDQYVASLLAHDGHLYVGGWFRFAGNKPSNYIARWDD